MRDLSELWTLGPDTANQRALRPTYAGTDAELWRYMHEQGNPQSENLKDVTFFSDSERLEQ